MGRDIHQLRHRLWNLEGRPYPAYKSVRGRYESGSNTLCIDRVQGDPFAAPSDLRYRMRGAFAGPLPPLRRRAIADLLLRRLNEHVRERARGSGSGKSGVIEIPRPSQAILARSAVELEENGDCEIRFRVGLPARGRTIMGEEAATLLCEELPSLLNRPVSSLEADAIETHCRCVEDAVALRSELRGRGLIAFVADGSILPRRSGVDDGPLDQNAHPTLAPESLALTLPTPHSGPLRGLAVPEGVTVIVGGGFHGKSTLLAALASGVYDHVPGDGRERVVSRPDVVKLRAEDGRAVNGVDITPFIGTLPNGRETDAFFTTNASGSTSQAAAFIEALEVGTSAILLDEDTSAANFLYRDTRMERLIPREGEPITPLIDRVRWLYETLGTSLVLVMGGAGDFFSVADTVLVLRDYEVQNGTEKAKRIAEELPSYREPVNAIDWTPAKRRLASKIDTRRGAKARGNRVRDIDRVSVGSSELDLASLEQLIEVEQTRFIAELLESSSIDLVNTSFSALAARVDELIAERGVSWLRAPATSRWSQVRGMEVIQALNRLRTLTLAID